MSSKPTCEIPAIPPTTSTLPHLSLALPKACTTCSCLVTSVLTNSISPPCAPAPAPAPALLTGFDGEGAAGGERSAIKTL